MVPVGIITKCVSVEPSVIEVVQSVKIMLCELIVRELVVSELIVAELIVGSERVVTSVCEIVTGKPRSITGHCVIVTEIMGGEVSAAATHRVTSKSVCVHGVSRKAMSAQRMAVAGKPMKPAAAESMGSKPVKSTASSKPMSAPAAKSMTTATTATPSGKCRDVRHDAKRAHRNARRQNSYRSLLHGAFPIDHF